MIDEPREYACSARAIKIIRFSQDESAKEIMELVWELGQGKYVGQAELLFFAEAREIQFEVRAHLVRLWVTGRLRMRYEKKTAGN